MLAENKMNTLINNPDVICMLLSKLPTYLQAEREAELADLTEMVDEETILVNDPLFPPEAIDQYLHNPNKFN